MTQLARAVLQPRRGGPLVVIQTPGGAVTSHIGTLVEGHHVTRATAAFGAGAAGTECLEGTDGVVCSNGSIREVAISL